MYVDVGKVGVGGAEELWLFCWVGAYCPEFFQD